MTDLTSKEWQEQIKQDPKAFIIDVRTPEEVEEGIIPTAINIDVMDPQAFMEGIQALHSDKTFYVYCRSGRRSAQACMILEQQGFDTTYNLLGGMLEWDGEVIEP